MKTHSNMKTTAGPVPEAPAPGPTRKGIDDDRYVILFSNKGEDGHVFYPAMVTYCYPLKKNQDGIHVQVTSSRSPSTVASFATEAAAKTFADRTIMAIENEIFFPDLKTKRYVLRNNMRIVTWANAQDLITQGDWHDHEKNPPMKDSPLRLVSLKAYKRFGATAHTLTRAHAIEVLDKVYKSVADTLKGSPIAREQAGHLKTVYDLVRTALSKDANTLESVLSNATSRFPKALKQLASGLFDAYGVQDWDELMNSIGFTHPANAGTKDQIATRITAGKRPSFEDAKRMYVHRFTMEHVPTWAKKKNEGNGKFYAPQFKTDREWYNNAKFKGEPGFYGKGTDAYTTGQTWPLGKWLDEPFSAVRSSVQLADPATIVEPDDKEAVDQFKAWLTTNVEKLDVTTDEVEGASTFFLLDLDGRYMGYYSYEAGGAYDASMIEGRPLDELQALIEPKQVYDLEPSNVQALLDYIASYY